MTLPGKEIELWLAGWRKTHNGGATVTFTIHDDDLPYFEAATIRKGKIAGQRYAAVLVQLLDNDQPDPESVPPKPVPQFPEGLCGLAIKLCKDSHFQNWLAKSFQLDWGRYAGERSEERARSVLLDVCRIISRKELDENPVAAENFKRVIYFPYCTHAKGAT